MPHWGIALALGPNYNMPPMPEREEKAWRAIDRAVALAPKAPERERAYVEALVTRYSKDPAVDRKQLAVNYRDAMKRVHSRYPDDLDAATLYAESIMNLRPWQLWSADGAPADGTLEVLDILEQVLRRDPDHPGANHYYIHAVEASKSPERALPSAYRLGRLMPGAGHLVHMPSHIYIRTGDHELSAVTNVTAAEVDRKYIERSGATGVYPLMYYSHNLHFVSYARMMQGRYDEAREYAQRLRKNVHGAIDEMPMLAPYGAFEWLVLTRFGKWNEMLAEAEPQEKVPAMHAYYRYARGLAMAGLGRTKDASAEAERLAAICARIPEDQTFMINPVRNVLGRRVRPNLQRKLPVRTAMLLPRSTRFERPWKPKTSSDTWSRPSGTTPFGKPSEQHCFVTGKRPKPKQSSAATCRSTPATVVRCMAWWRLSKRRAIRSGPSL